MTALKNLNLNSFKARPKLPGAARVIPAASKEFEQIVKEETQMADAEIAVTDAIINSTPGGVIHDPAEENISDESEKLNRLVDDEFPFDESQLEAVGGMIQQKYACMIGAAGTGKTTLEKKLVDLLQDGLDEVDVSQYWKRGAPEEHDDYEIPERLIPSILMCSFTGRSTQMTKKNFPREWHPNIMTIHRALGFYPEFYPDVDEESGEMINKRRFVPSYTADNQMPWDIIIIDEAGMLGLDLWHQLWAAIKPDARVYMVGDINQLPPTHGKSILGFALGKWPTWELTHVHRQQGANNSIVDNAHRVLQGLRPIGDSPKQLSIVPLTSAPSAQEKMKPMLEALQFMATNDSWRFLTVDVDAEHKVAAIRIRQMLKLLHGKIYEPNRDVVITPINGFEQTAPGYSLGQQPMNQELVTMLNQDSPRYLIDAGREKMNFAIGDKVMATMNDYEQGVTNGMTGIVTKIAENGAYLGDTRRFGLIELVNEYYEGLDDDDEEVDFSLEEMVSDAEAGMAAAREREKKSSGPASHIVTVMFGEGEHSFEIAFASQSQVATLMLAYVATCHKLQGGEAPLVFVIVHGQNKRLLCREWLYTAITRGSHRVVLLQTKQGVGFAVGKQTIKGKTLREKIQSFADLTKSSEVGGLNFGASVNVKLPQPRSLVTDVTIHAPSYLDRVQPKQENSLEKIIAQEVAAPKLDRLKVPQREIKGERVSATRPATPEERIVVERIIEVHHYHAATPANEPEPAPKDGGDLTPHHEVHAPAALPVPHPQLGALHMQLRITHDYEVGPKLLTYQPETHDDPVPTPPVAPDSDGIRIGTGGNNRLLALLAKSKAPSQAAAEAEAKGIESPQPLKKVNSLGALLARQNKS